MCFSALKEGLLDLICVCLCVCTRAIDIIDHIITCARGAGIAECFKSMRRAGGGYAANACVNTPANREKLLRTYLRSLFRAFLPLGIGDNIFFIRCGGDRL